MAFLIVKAGSDYAKPGNLQVAGVATDRKAVTVALRSLPKGEYDLLQVTETGLLVRDRATVASVVVVRGTATRQRTKKDAPAKDANAA